MSTYTKTALAQTSPGRLGGPQAIGYLSGAAKKPNACRGGWTDDRVEKLKALHKEGLSASQIAKQLGGVTRNAVIGKVTRMGLGPIGGGRASPPPVRLATGPRGGAGQLAKAMERAADPPPPRSRARAKCQPLPHVLGPGHTDVVKPPTPLPPREEPAGLATVLTLGAHMCKWPIGDPRDADFSFCGRRRDGERPYCAAHERVAYQAPQPGKKKPSANELARSLRRYI